MRKTLGFVAFVAGFIVLIAGPIQASEARLTIELDDTGTITLTDDPDRGIPLMDTPPARTPILPNEEELKDYVFQAAEEFNLPEGLIFAVIRAESFGDHQARSEAGAVGLMQLMPATAEMLGVEDSTDPRQNIFGGSEYLARMLQRFDGDLDLALAAYNAGPTRVERVGGVPNIDETQQYVKRVQDGFDRFETRDRVIYIYEDEDGRTNITNLRADER